MIKQTLREETLHLSIAKTDFSYRIPLKKLGNTIDWKIGSRETKGIVVAGVSIWMLQLFTKKITEDKYIKHFKSIVEEHSPTNTINWEATLLAVNIQNQYNWLTTTNKAAKKKASEEEIISGLKKKFDLD